MLHLPKFVYIFGVKYKVLIVKEIKDIDGTIMENYDGLILFENCTIQIHKDQSQDDAEHSLVHEMSHATNKHGSVLQVISHEIDEIQSDQIATAITNNFHLVPKW